MAQLEVGDGKIEKKMFETVSRLAISLFISRPARFAVANAFLSPKPKQLLEDR
jgi:hypothetical protein